MCQYERGWTENPGPFCFDDRNLRFDHCCGVSGEGGKHRDNASGGLRGFGQCDVGEGDIEASVGAITAATTEMPVSLSSVEER